MAKQRNLGIDLLRALAMFFVVIWHFVGQGGLLEHAEPSSLKYWILSAVQILTVCCVNLYGLTTGYLMCDKPFRLSRVVKLWVTTVFWSVAVSCVLFIIFPEIRTFEEIVSMFLPILRGRYWFFTAYFVVMMVSPVLNLVIRSLTKGQFRLLLAVLFLIFGVIPVGSLGYDVLRISTGHHFSWMIVLYLIGGYIRTNVPPPPEDARSKISDRLFPVCSNPPAVQIGHYLSWSAELLQSPADLPLSVCGRRSNLSVPVFQGCLF